jgi:hypothetical protein
MSKIENSSKLYKTPNGCLTGPNGLPNGSNFCKPLIRWKVYGLTGKIPPGALSNRFQPSPPLGCPSPPMKNT